MEAHLHTMSNLFAQLGLPADPTAIDDFISAHRPLGSGVAEDKARPGKRRDERPEGPFHQSLARCFLDA